MHTGKSSKNFLLNTVYSDEMSQVVFRLALRLSRLGKKVLYIAAKPPESLPIVDEYDDAVYRDILKNMVLKYSSNARDLISYFMSVKQLQPRPDAVIVDFLHTFFGNLSSMDSDNLQEKYFIECHMLITAGLHSAIDMLSNNNINQSISIIAIDPDFHPIYKQFIQTYVDLYYYKEGCILSSKDLSTHFS